MPSIESHINFPATKPGWQGVGNISLKLWNTSNARQSDVIFGNDCHQIVILALIDLTDSNGNPLSDPYLPTAQVVKNSCTLLNYIDQSPFGSFSSMGWTISNDYNSFLQPIQDSTTLNINIQLDTVDTQEDYIQGSRAYLHFYITSSKDTSAVEVGLSVELLDNFGLPTISINSSLNGKFHSSVNITSITRIEYKSADFSWSGSQKFHGGDEFDGITVESSEQNRWREFQYAVKLDRSKYVRFQNNISRAYVTNSQLYDNYCFGSKYNSLYSFYGYLWPNNIYEKETIMDPNGKPKFPTGSNNTFHMETNGFDTRYTSVYTAEGSLSLTLLCVFGDDFLFGYNYKPLILRIYDQYGNDGFICVDPETIPELYKSNDHGGMIASTFFSDSENDQPSKEKKKECTFITDGSQPTPNRAGAYGYSSDKKMIMPEKNILKPNELDLIFSIEPKKGDSFAAKSIFIQIYLDIPTSLYIDNIGYLCSTVSKEGVAFAVVPHWEVSSTCIATLDFASILAFVFDGNDHYYDEIQMIDKSCINPDVWPDHKPFPIGYANFDWYFEPMKSIK